MRTSSGQRGLSVLEILVVVATIGLLIAFFLPLLASPSRPVARTARIRCVNHLKQIGLAFLLYAEDHEDQFPWMVSTNFNPTRSSGSLEYVNSGEVFRHFQAASNELNVPRILHCPTDGKRTAAPDFVKIGNSNLSYFVGVDAMDNGDPQMILSGDRNILGGTFERPNLMLVRTNRVMSWSNNLHVLAGNVGLADGSVQQMTATQLNQQFASVTNAVVRLAIP
jgi:hypothetical protein